MQEARQWAQSMVDLTVDKLKSAFPIQTDDYTVEIKDVDRINTDGHVYDYDNQRKSMLNEIDFTVPIRGKVIVKDKEGKVLSQETATLLDLPALTARGTFIIDGKDYSIKHQLRRKPGVYTHVKENGELESEVLVKGANYKVSLDPKTGLFTTDIRGKTRPLYSLFKALNIPDAEIINSWGEKLYKINSDKFKEKHVQDIKDMVGTEDLESHFRNHKVDYGVMQATLGKYNDGHGQTYITPKTFLDTSKKLLEVSKDEEEPDERDSLNFKSFTPANKIFGQYVDNTANIVAEGIKKNLRRGITDAKTVVNTGYANSAIRKFFSLDLVNAAERTNPIAIAAAPKKVTLLGTGAIDDENKVPNESRDIHPTQMGFIDPVQTPAGNAGVVTNLTIGASFNPSKGTLKTTILDKKGKEKSISPEEMYNMAIAFPDQFKENGKPKYEKLRVTLRGKIREVDPKQVDGRLINAEQMFGLNANLIPFLGSDSGNRALMASAMFEQAVSLKDREIPIIDTSIEGKPGTKVAADRFITKSPIAGKVADVTDSKIIITGDTGKTYEVPMYKNFPISNDSYIHEEAVVKPGDTVKAGQRLTDNNFTKDGHLAIGKNLRIGYMPGSGYTFEDGFVLTEQGAKKLTSQHMFRFDIPKDENHLFRKDAFIAKYPGKFKSEDIQHLDSRGVVRRGSTILPGQPVATYLKKSTSEELSRVHKKFGDIYKKGLVEWDNRFPGEVVDVHEDDKKFTVFVRGDSPAQVGDKLAGRHGNKGVVTRIIPATEAPTTVDGLPLDIIISAAGIPSRMNAGQVQETALAKVMKHRGIDTVQIPNFSTTNTSEDILNELKKAGITGKEKIIDPITGRALKNPVNVGYQYFFKLEQQADKKTQSRSIGGYDMDERPIRGKHGGGQSANRLFVNALLAHGARENLYEMGHIKSQKNDEYWRALKMGLPVPPPVQTPFAVRKFYDYLGGLGVTNKKEGSKIYLLPMTSKQILEKSNGEIESGKFIRGKDGEPIVGGLFDPKVTGGAEGTKWAHITLSREIPNPVFEKAIINLAGLTEQKFEDALTHKYFYDPTNNEWSDKKTKSSLTGVNALKRSLRAIDINQELRDQLKKSQTINNPTDLNKLSRKVRYLKALKDNDLTTDVYFMKHVPVVPPTLRPLYQRDGALVQSPLNKLYSNLALYNEKWKDINYDSKNLSGRVYANLYGHVKGLYGLQDTTIQGRPFKGIIEQIKGDVPKYGFFQKKLISKRQDLSARAVITLNTDLGPDQIGLPYNIAWEVYKPFVMRRMTQNGFNPLMAHEQIEKQTPLAEKFLQQEVAVRPVMMSRDPVLHKYGVLGFKPVLKKGIKSLQISPLITKSVGGDFDGDTMSLHVPISSVAIQEVNKLMPTNILISPADKKFTLKPDEDALLGLHYATRIDKTQAPVAKFSTGISAAQALVNSTDYNADDVIHVDGKISTFGREFVKHEIPGVALPEEGINGSNLNTLLKGINDKYTDQYGDKVNKLTQIGNRVAYMHGFSVGLEDLIGVPKVERKKLFTETMDKIRKMETLAGGSGFMTKPQKELKNQILFTGANKAIDIMNFSIDPEKNNLMKMVSVGSKGKPEQVAQMLVTPFAVGTMSGNASPYPIGKSYSEGMGISDYFLAQYGARKGAVDSRLEVSEPGFMAKQLVNTSMGNVISMADCGTKKGRKLPIGQADIQDRFLAEATGGIPAGQLMTSESIQALKKQGIREIIVRSPIYCEALDGTCQKCYGIDVTGKLAPVGTNVGVISATSMSEPLTQMALSSRHTSGSQAGGATAYLGIPRIKQITQMPATMPGSAVIAMNSGTVDVIEDAPAGGQYVSIDGNDHYIHAGTKILHKLQEKVMAGDKLTDGNIHPVEYQHAVGDINKTRELLTNQLNESYSAVGKKMRDVIYETYVKSMTNMARIKSSPSQEVLPGTYTTINKAKAAEQKYGVTWDPVMKGAMTLPTINPDYMSRMGFTHLKDSILDASNAGEFTDIHSYDPIPAWVHSKEFGKGVAGRY